MRTRKVTEPNTAPTTTPPEPKTAKEKMHGRAWLPVTSQKTGFTVYLPLPIRLITQIPDEKGGGCVVRGAHGDESTAKESIAEILGLLGGFPLKSASSWSLAG